MSPLNKSLGIDQCACFATRKAARRITRFYDSYLEPAGLRITQFLTLAALSEVDSVAVNALAERLDIERTAMGKMAGFLERDGFVSIEASPTDGRSRLIRLTEAGHRLHEKAAPLWQEAQQQFEVLNGPNSTSETRQRLSNMKLDDSKSTRSDGSEYAAN